MGRFLFCVAVPGAVHPGRFHPVPPHPALDEPEDDTLLGVEDTGTGKGSGNCGGLA